MDRFGTNLTIEEEKVEFPKGKENIKVYSVSPSLVGPSISISIVRSAVLCV
jgi:hypothetical protein